MPQNMDYALYFNIAFFSVIGLGFIIGYFRGLKKSLWSLLVTVIFYGLFFLSIETVINALWTIEMSSVIQYGTSFMPELANASTIGDAVYIALETYVGEQLGDTLSNANFLALVTGLAQFVLKLVYMILYFTVGRVIYSIITFILRLIFIKNSKYSRKTVIKMKKEEKARKKMYKKMSRKERKAYDKQAKKYKKKGLDPDGNKIPKSQKRPLIGALLGATKGAVSAFIGLIMLGGMMNITESFMNVLPETTDPTVARLETIYLSNEYTPSVNVPNIEVETAAPFTVPQEMDSYLPEVRNMITAYNENIFVTTTSQITMTDPSYPAPVALNIFLFDSVLSFNYGDQNVKLRKEIEVLTDAAGILLGSDFIETNSINDISSEDIVDVFDSVAQSDFITSMIPLAIEVGSDYVDVPVEVPVEELYAIDWKSEISTLGAIVAVGFDLVNTAGLLEEDPDLTTITIDGTDVRDLFDSLGESELVTLGAYVAMEPLLASLGEDMSAIITVPEDMEWSDEFSAFGLVAESILDTGITVGDLQSGDPMILINSMASLDFTVLLSSEIVSHALKNIFSGEAGIEGMEMIVVPTDIVWFDVYNTDGTIQTPGELRNILLAVNSITTVVDGFDFSNIGLDVISEFTDDTIDTIFDSEILVATISGFVLDMDLGDTPLIIPDAALDLNDYITSIELKTIARSAKILVEDLACDDGDTVCEETGFDIAKAFSLSDAAIDTLTSSEILGATIGNLIIDTAGDILTVPNSALATISVDGVNQDVVSKAEIKKVFQAVSTLGFTDLDNMAFDASIISGLGLETDTTTLDETKSAKLFNSKIVHATLSSMLFEQTEGASSPLAVPYFDVENNAVRSYDAGDELEYLSTDELNNILQALLTLDISDFAAVDNLDLDLIITNSDDLLASAILHATISKQVFDLGGDIISIPYEDELGNDVRVTVGSALDSTETEYIVKDEITGVLDALEVLDMTDIGSFDGTVDLASITSEPTNVTTILSSAILHATISDQLIQLDTDGTIQVPHVKEDDITAVRVTVGDVGFETEYIVKAEIESMIDALDILGVADMDSFSGTIDLAPLMEGTNKDTVLQSATIQATISEQLINLDTNGTVQLPYYKQDGTTPVRVTVGEVGQEVEYVTIAEISAMLDALDRLGISDVESFGGSVSLTTLNTDDNATVILSSSMIHATVSEQVLNLDTDGTIEVPFLEENGTTDVRVTVGDPGFETEYIITTEIEAMIDGLQILGIDDVETFDGTIDLTPFFEETPRNTLLGSSIMQATISKQLVDLGDSVLTIPTKDAANGDVRVVVGALETETEYVKQDEISAMFEALEALGFTDINDFSGTVDLNNVYGDTNQDIILASASMHATITKQMMDLGPSVLIIPDTDIDGTSVQVTVDSTDFITKTEIKSMINALEILGIGDITTFDGAFNISVLSTNEAQNTLLSSASLHATITKTMLDLDDAVLIVPMYTQDGETIGNEVQKNVSATDFVVKGEIKALINAFTSMGFTDLNSFGTELDSSQFFDDSATLLLSSSIQATLSDKMLNGTGDVLIVPNVNVNNASTVRIVQTDVEYIDITEMTNMIDALDELGLTDFSTMSFDAATIFTVDFDTLLLSASIQATISDTIIPNAADGDTPVGASSLIVPTYFREDITVGVTASKQIEKVELKALLTSLDTLGADFGGSMSPSTVTNMSDTDLDTLFASGSVHTTVDNMLQSNSNINSFIPDLAKEDAAYRTDITTAAEIKAFIKATKLISAGSIADVSIDLAVIAGLSEPDRAIVVDSMIIRNAITPTLVNIEFAQGLLLNPTYGITATDYMGDDPLTFFKKAEILLIIDFYAGVV